MSKQAEKEQKDNNNLKINTDYLRESATDFSLAPKGQEIDIEINKCNYYTDRKADASPQYIVQTYSVGSLKNTLAKMVLPNGGNISELRGPAVSVHYIIDQEGTIFQLVPDTKRAWAAGVGNLTAGSKLNPAIAQGDMQNAMNDYGITIMSINDGKSPLTPQQYAANEQLTSNLVKSYAIDPTKVIALADWTPGRHIAPGPFFPWHDFSKAGLGLWSDVERPKDPEIIVSYKKKPLPEEVDHIQQAFEELLKKYSTGSSGDVVKQYAASTQSLKESLSKSVIDEARAVGDALSRGLGMVGKPNDKDQAGHLDSGTLSSMLSFNLHHLGEKIVNSPLLDVYNVLWADSSDPDARGILGQWGTDSQAVLDSLLDS